MKGQDVDLIGVDQPIHNAVGASNDFSNLWIDEFWNGTAGFRENFELVSSRNQLAHDNRGVVRGILRDEGLDGREV